MNVGYIVGLSYNRTIGSNACSASCKGRLQCLTLHHQNSRLIPLPARPRQFASRLKNACATLLSVGSFVRATDSLRETSAHGSESAGRCCARRYVTSRVVAWSRTSLRKVSSLHL